MGHGASMDDIFYYPCLYMRDRGNYYSYLWTIPLTLPNTDGGVKKYSVSREGGLPYQNQRSAICAEAAQQQAKKRKVEPTYYLARGKEKRRTDCPIGQQYPADDRRNQRGQRRRQKGGGDSERDPLHQEIGNF